MRRSVERGARSPERGARSPERGARSARGGFSLIELLIALLLFGFLIAGVWSVLQSQSRGIAIQDQVVEIHSNLRVGMWDAGLDLMHAGLGRVYVRDPADGTTCRDLGVLDASPFQITFLYDLNDSASGGAADGPAFTWDNGNGSVPNQICPTSSCDTGCSTTANPSGGGAPQLHGEIVRLTLDGEDDSSFAISASVASPPGSAADGSSRTIQFSPANSVAWMGNISLADDGDAASPNPGDFLLSKEVISRDAATSFFEPLAYGLRGPGGSLASGFTAPVNELGESFALFTYYLDSNFDGFWQCTAGAGPDAIKGDTNGDCSLSSAEVQALMVPAAGVLTPSELLRVLRVDVQMRGETQRADPLFAENGGFRSRVLRSSFRLNNMAFPP